MTTTAEELRFTYARRSALQDAENARGAAIALDRLQAAVGPALQQLALEEGVSPHALRLIGSLAYGGFEPARSDVDIVCWGLTAVEANALGAALDSLIPWQVQILRAERAPAALVERALTEGVLLHAS